MKIQKIMPTKTIFETSLVQHRRRGEIFQKFLRPSEFFRTICSCDILTPHYGPQSPAETVIFTSSFDAVVIENQILRSCQAVTLNGVEYSNVTSNAVRNGKHLPGRSFPSWQSLLVTR